MYIQRVSIGTRRVSEPEKSEHQLELGLWLHDKVFETADIQVLKVKTVAAPVYM